jgi:hypothetical protein
MEQLPPSIILTIAVLTAFLIFITALRYSVPDSFTRTKLSMTMFFCFIVATLTISFWQYTLDTLPYTIPASLLGVVMGWLIGVRAAEDRVRTEGLAHYMEHFAHVHIGEGRRLTWWSVINFYTVMGALLLINFVGLSTVIFNEAKNWALITSSIGAFLLGTLVPYLIHVWSIGERHKAKSTTSE